MSAIAAFTLPTPQYSTGTFADSNTPADSVRSANTTKVLGNSGMVLGAARLVVDGCAQAQRLPGVIPDELQIDQHRQRPDLVACAYTKIGGPRHRAAGREHVIDQQ